MKLQFSWIELTGQRTRQFAGDSFAASPRRRVASLNAALLLCALFPALANALAVNQQSGKTAQTATTPQKAAPLTTEEIDEARQRLDQLGYWLDTAATGLDASLRHALTAFQKIEGRKRTGILTRPELEALRLAERPVPQETADPHIEIDLFRQVLFLQTEPGAEARILPVSTGSGEWFTEGGVTRRAMTPTGQFEIMRKIEGWRKSPLGLLYYPNYFYDGVAIHGNPSVPPTPASHGCIRIPMFAAKSFSQLAPVGMPVIIYDSNPLAQTPAVEQPRAKAGKGSRLACN